MEASRADAQRERFEDDDNDAAFTRLACLASAFSSDARSSLISRA